jgi:hypothetical protein
MSSIFGHDLGAVYRDPAYALRGRASWLAIGAAFAVGVGVAVAVMKVPAGQTEEPTQTMASRGATKPSTSPARAVADRTETRAKAPVRVIAPDVIPPPPNVTTASGREPPADPNAGVAARDQLAHSTVLDTVPMPPPKPAELRVGVAGAPADAATTGAAAALPPSPPPAASVEPPAQELGAKMTRRETKAARREARRLAREERRRMAQERLRAWQERYEAEDWAPPGRRYTIYRRYDDDRSRAMAYGDEYRSGRRGFFGLFDFD